MIAAVSQQHHVLVQCTSCRWSPAPVLSGGGTNTTLKDPHLIEGIVFQGDMKM